MRNIKVERGLAVGIILLFVGTGIIPSMTQNIEKPSLLTSRGDWLYVGGSGPGNYTKIQDAINASSDGDTIFVFDDSSPYIENIKVYKEINLFGEDKNSTQIKGINPNDEVITITTADFVTISGFTISSDNENSLPVIQIYSSYNTISGNIFEDNKTTFETNEIGINLVTSCHSCTINDNIFQNTSKGVKIEGSSFNAIYNNSFLSNSFGIIVFYGKENTIVNNTFMNENWGMLLSHSNYSKVIDNVFISCRYEGIEIGTDCSNNGILRNNISLCGHGISVNLMDNNNRFQNNSLRQNFRGIYISSSCDYNLLENNKIIDNQDYGIWIQGSNNEIHFNLIKDNKEVGILVSGKNNNISYNMIENNTKGVYLSEGANYNLITFNNFIKNSGFFMYSFKQRKSKYNVWDCNYWDSLRGNIKIIVGRLKIVLYSWVDWMSKEVHEIAVYPLRLNFDWRPAREPYDIPMMR